MKKPKRKVTSRMRQEARLLNLRIAQACRQSKRDGRLDGIEEAAGAALELAKGDVCPHTRDALCFLVDHLGKQTGSEELVRDAAALLGPRIHLIPMVKGGQA